MTPPEQTPLRALSDTVEQWSRETGEFFSALEQQLHAAHAGLAALESAPGQAAEADLNAVRGAANDALAERLALLQSENELMREELALEAGARSTLEARIESLQTLQQEFDSLQHRVRELEGALENAREQLAALNTRDASAPPESPKATSKPQATAFEVPVVRAFDGKGHKKKTGEILVEEGIITRQQLQQLLDAQAGSPQVRLGALAIERGFTSEALVAKVLAAQLRLPYVDLQTITIDPAAIALLSNHLARLHQCIPLQHDTERLVVAMSNPLDLIAIEDIELASKLRVEPVVASSSAIQTALERHYPLWA